LDKPIKVREFGELLELVPDHRLGDCRVVLVGFPPKKAIEPKIRMKPAMNTFPIRIAIVSMGYLLTF
jgi:hypothetical protein